MTNHEGRSPAASGTQQTGREGNQTGKKDKKGKKGNQGIPKPKFTPEQIAELKENGKASREDKRRRQAEEKTARAKEAEERRMAEIAAPPAQPPSRQSECYLISISSLLSMSFGLITMYVFHD